MTDLLTLIKRLLKQVPNGTNVYLFDESGVEYVYLNKLKYTIAYWECNSTYHVRLSITELNPYHLLNDFEIEVSEKDYMEIKWKCKEWEEYLRKQQLDAFEEFVDSFSDDSMDSLLNE